MDREGRFVDLLLHLKCSRVARKWSGGTGFGRVLTSDWVFWGIQLRNNKKKKDSQTTGPKGLE